MSSNASEGTLGTTVRHPGSRDAKFAAVVKRVDGRRVMGAATSGWLSRVILMITFIGMAGSVVALLLSSLHG